MIRIVSQSLCMSQTSRSHAFPLGEADSWFWRLSQCAAPNKRVHATASSVRSFLASAFGSA